jgi:hypothetical protein
MQDYSLYNKAFLNLSKNETNLTASYTLPKENQNSFSTIKIKTNHKFEFSPVKNRNLNLVFSKQKIQKEPSSNILNKNNIRNSLYLPNLQTTLSKENCMFSNNEDIENKRIDYDDTTFEFQKEKSKRRSNLKNYQNFERKEKEKILPRINDYVKTNESNKVIEINKFPALRKNSEIELPQSKKNSAAIIGNNNYELERLLKLPNYNINRNLGSKVKFRFNEINDDELDLQYNKQQKGSKIINKISSFSESKEKKEEFFPSKLNLNKKLNSARASDLAKKHLETSRKILSKSFNKKLLQNTDFKLDKKMKMLEVEMKIINLKKFEKQN